MGSAATGFDLLAEAGAANAQRQSAQNMQLKGLQRQQAIAANQDAALNIATALRTGKHPDTGADLTPADIHDLTQKHRELVAHTADLFNPHVDPSKFGPATAEASGVPQAEGMLHKLTDQLHLTKPPVATDPRAVSSSDPSNNVPARTPSQVMQELQAISQQYRTQPGQEEAAAASRMTLSQMEAKSKAIDSDSNLTADEKAEAHRRLHGVTGSENYKVQPIVLSDGNTISAQYDSKSGKWSYLTGEEIPPALLKGAKPVVKPVAVKGTAFDKATGQVIDKDTGKRYNAGDAANPPEIAAIFKQQSDMDKKAKDFQLKLAAARGAAYNSSKPIISLDSANGNAPVAVTFAQMQQNPGRYVPAGEADKAIAKENLMQDIAGTSALTRKAINGMRVDFPEDMKAKIALAMKADDPHSALDNLVASGALGSLTSDQQDFLIATRQLAENAMAMRSILGAGQGSEDVRSAIRDTLPTLLSPDKQFALKQLNAFDATINRLHRGVPKVKLNEGAMNKGSRSLKAAMALPINKGKSQADVQKDLESHGYTVKP